MSLQAISIAPGNGNPPQNLLIMLHGWGANYQDLVPLASYFNLPDCQFLFPNAPFPHPQVPGGKSWYSLESSDYTGMAESRELLFNWVLSLEGATGVPLSRTILSGFSQGGAMILDVGLTLPVAGLCSLSGYLHFQPEAVDFNFPPVFMVHGKQDPVVPLIMAQQAKDKLTALGVNIEYHEFDGGHEIPLKAIALMQQFIEKI